MENQAPQCYTSLHPDEMNLALKGTTFRPSESRQRPRPWLRCFRDRRLWKLLFIVLLVLVLATLVLTICTFIKLHHHFTETSVIPVTPDAEGKVTANKNITPCDDVYHFVCRDWGQKNPKPEDWPLWDNFKKLEFHNNNKLSQIFENSKDLQLKSEAEEKAKLFYFTCMDANGTIEKQGKLPIFDLINKLGGWNISSKTVKFNSSTFTSTELQETIQTMKKFAGVDSFFEIYVQLDNVYTKNNSNYILTLYPLEKPLGYSPDNYQQYMIKIATLLEADKDSLQQQMEAVFFFYKSLLNNVSEKPVPKAMMLSELDNLVSFINWTEYFQKIAPASIKTLRSNDVVVLSDVYFFGNLSKLVNDHLQGHNNRIILKNFLIWRAVETMAGYLPKAFEDTRREQMRKTSYTAVGRSSEYCAYITNTYFSFAAAAVFHQKMYDTNSTKLVKLMFNNLKKTFNKKLDNLLRLDLNDKQIMKNKADTMSLLIGFPDFILNANELDKYYSSVNVRENALFTNVMEAEVQKYQRQFTLLGQNAQEASWPFHLSLTPLHIDAIYRKEVNQIVLPIGILQHPYLQPRQQIHSNFGNLGFLLGHEFMHAFVNRELSSDENGWPQNIKEMFQEMHGCVSKQYSKCGSPEHCVTLNEDMADISGIKLAYSAFLDWKAKQQSQITRRIFFLTFVQMWCTNGNGSHEQQYHHSEFKIRANKPLSYLHEFAEEFKCKQGSKMNPQHRCNVF